MAARIRFRFLGLNVASPKLPPSAAKAHAAATAPQAAHILKMSAKAARNANPTARAAALAQINAPILQPRRLASIHAISLELAAKHNVTPAECMTQAANTLAQIEGNAAYWAAVKRQRSAKVYPADGTVAHTFRNAVPAQVAA